MSKHKVLKVKGLFIRDEKGEVSRIDDCLYSFEEMMVHNLYDLKREGLELFVEVEGDELEVEEDFRFYVYRDLAATKSYDKICNGEHWTVTAKSQEDAIETVRKEIGNGY